MRYIKLCPESVEQLEELYKKSSNMTIRMRSHCLLLSNKGLQINDLSKIFEASRNTICTWFNLWESKSYEGLEIRPGRGAKGKLNTVSAEWLKEQVDNHSRKLEPVLESLDTAYGIQASKKTLQRWLKKNGNIPGVESVIL